METMQQNMSTTVTDLQGRMERMGTDLRAMSSRMETMQQSMSTIQGVNPPAWKVNSKEYCWAAEATVVTDGTQPFLEVPLMKSRIKLEHGAVSCKQLPDGNAGWYVIAIVTAWPVVPEL
eukprot:2314382-Amphidinium_carterae.1